MHLSLTVIGTMKHELFEGVLSVWMDQRRDADAGAPSMAGAQPRGGGGQSGTICGGQGGVGGVGGLGFGSTLSDPDEPWESCIRE